MNRLNQRINHLLRRLKLSAISRWNRVWLTLSWSLIRGKLVIPSSVEELNFVSSGLFPSKYFDFYRVHEIHWLEAEEISRAGKYHAAVRIRHEILEELYAFSEVTTPGYFPPVLGTQWTSNFGHLACLGHHSLAQRLGVIPEGRRYLTTNGKSPNEQLLQSVSQDFTPVFQPSGTRWSEAPSFWHFSERLRTVRGHSNFIDLNELFDTIFTSRNYEKLVNEDSFLKLETEYTDSARIQLERMGLPRNAKFVALHVRESIDITDPRTQPLDSFRDAVNEITSQGFWVIRIGDRGMRKFPTSRMVIDLVGAIGAGANLHTYVLANCLFFLGTASGPSWVSRLYGQPSLLTNLNCVGIQANRAPRGSIHIPKRYFGKDKYELSLSEVYSTGLAFGEVSLKELNDRGISQVGNSPREILEATKEILSNVSGCVSDQLQTEQLRIREIREDFKSIAWGNFACSFIEENPKWLR